LVHALLATLIKFSLRLNFCREESGEREDFFLAIFAVQRNLELTCTYADGSQKVFENDEVGLKGLAVSFSVAEYAEEQQYYSS
jgi:hypothetical protein